MIDLSRYLHDEIRLHPSLMPQDVVKLCYQAAFGAEHVLNNPAKAKAYFQEEYVATPADGKPLAEYIAPDVCRVNLSAWKRLGLDPEWLWGLFVYTVPKGDAPLSGNDVFEGFLAQVDKLCEAGVLPFPNAIWQEYIIEYKKSAAIGQGGSYPPVRHSDNYRAKEKSAYRILCGMTVLALPIFEKMAGFVGGVIAIDGRAAAGKSTLSVLLGKVINSVEPAGIIIRMDDFFLPPELRTPERLSQPGGNVHYERFAQEVLPHLRGNSKFEYRKFDCSFMGYSSTPAEIIPHPWRIVEGVYSCHPALGDYMDIRVFMDINPEEQKTRIMRRNGEKIAADYFAKWIPMEEAYFKAHNPGGILLCSTPRT